MIKILIAGEGGQGVQLIAEFLAKAAFSEGKSSLYIPNFGVEQRGGVSLAFITIDSDLVVYPKFEKADILAVLCDRAIERVENYVSQETQIIFGPAITKTEIINISSDKIIRIKPVDFPAKVWNILILAKIISLSNLISLDSAKRVMEEKLAKKFEKDPGLKELDLRALNFKE